MTTLECLKYQHAVAIENPHCPHATDYCQHRTSCLVVFLEKEQKYEQAQQQRTSSTTGAREREHETMELNFAKSADGLLPAIVQDHATGTVLMLAYINLTSWQKTLETGKAHFWSRSRNKLWLKGESSGHLQVIKEIYVDCDDDTVLLKVEQLGGAACHVGYQSCFYRRVEQGQPVIIGEPVFDPATVYNK